MKVMIISNGESPDDSQVRAMMDVVQFAGVNEGTPYVQVLGVFNGSPVTFSDVGERAEWIAEAVNGLTNMSYHDWRNERAYQDSINTAARWACGVSARRSDDAVKELAERLFVGIGRECPDPQYDYQLYAIYLREAKEPHTLNYPAWVESMHKHEDSKE
jgi:hypothetical protein